ncbi:hypothetical protein F8M41_018358 [Gigaspora margarita]|uniref:Uncharacterized protein n=1 Tax=Gigaspora margarita TaxID=4874 RepID=A0A8H4ELE7_GIGMA|nr:hypothetical protein F8M41_018358 [Gigaspora margarita]
MKSLDNDDDDANEDENEPKRHFLEIKKQFLEADKIAKELPIVSPKHSDIIYTSKIIDTQAILSAVKD